MEKMVKRRVLKGRRYSHIDRSGEIPKRVQAAAGDIVEVSLVAAKRFPQTLGPVDRHIEPTDRTVKVDEENKALKDDKPSAKELKDTKGSK